MKEPHTTKWEDLTPDEQAAFTAGAVACCDGKDLADVAATLQYPAGDTRGFWFVVGFDMAEKKGWLPAPRDVGGRTR